MTTQFNPSDPTGRNTIHCPACNGSGYSKGAKCTRCLGEGRVVLRETSEGIQERKVLNG
jgi:DnaJ-class molecular chaperone